MYGEIIKQLRNYGHVLTEHIADEGLTQDGEAMSDREIHDRDIEWLRTATSMIAEVTTPSLGVGYEIGRAVEWGIPVLCFFRPDSGRKLSAMIAGCAGVRMMQYGSADDFPALLLEFFSGTG